MFGNPILELLTAHKATHVLGAATKLGVFSMLSEGAMTADELAEQCEAVPHLLTAMLDCCVAMGLLHRHGDLYSASHLAEAHLVEGGPHYLGDLVKLADSEAGAWDGLYGLLQTGARYGAREPEPEIDAGQFTMAMHNLAVSGEAEALVDAVSYDGSGTMVDVGCGSGAYSIAFCRRHPLLRAVLIDRAQVLVTTRQIVDQYGLGDRLVLHPADMLQDEYGEEVDLVLLSDVLYRESSTCQAILGRAYDALAPGGTLVVRGYFSDPGGSGSPFGAFFTMSMLLSDPSRDPITLDRICEWVKRAGFEGPRTTTPTELSTCVTATKPSTRS